jgi:hypothetical protein
MPKTIFEEKKFSKGQETRFFIPNDKYLKNVFVQRAEQNTRLLFKFFYVGEYIPPHPHEPVLMRCN